MRAWAEDLNAVSAGLMSLYKVLIEFSTHVFADLVVRILAVQGCVISGLQGLWSSWGLGYPDPRKDLESRSPNLGPYTTKGTL